MLSDRKKNILFVTCTYALCWLIIVVAILTGVLQREGIVLQLTMLVIPWSPTIVLVIFFKALFPGSTLKGFYQNAFRERVNIRLFLVVTIVQALIFICAPGMIVLTKGVAFTGLFNLSLQSVVSCVVVTLITGATGEESGWRGFLHAPLWFVTSGFEGMELLQYIVAFVITIVSLAVMIGICYRRCRSLFVPMWMHFMFNLVAPAFTGSMLDFMSWNAVFYGIAAIGYSIWHIKIQQSKSKENRV